MGRFAASSVLEAVTDLMRDLDRCLCFKIASTTFPFRVTCTRQIHIDVALGRHNGSAELCCPGSHAVSAHA